MPGRHPLSLHDERGERRAKGRGETHLDGFSSPFGNPHLFRKSRNASARQARGVSRLRVRKGSSRDVEISISTAPSAREPPNDTVSVSHRRFSDGGEPRPGSARWQVHGSRHRRLRYQFLKLIPATLAIQISIALSPRAPP